MTTILQFSISGIIIPYVRMTQRSKFTKRAKIYLASQQGIQVQLRNQMNNSSWDMLPGQTPLKVSLLIWCKKVHTKDSDNQLKAVFDAGNKIIYPDDRWIDRLRLERYEGEDKAIFTVEVI